MRLLVQPRDGVAVAGPQGRGSRRVAPRARESVPRSAELNYNLGNALKETGDHEGALKHYCAAGTLDPDDLEAARACGGILMRLERFDEAVEHYAAALGRHRDDSRLCAGLGVALWKLRRAGCGLGSAARGRA